MTYLPKFIVLTYFLERQNVNMVCCWGVMKKEKIMSILKEHLKEIVMHEWLVFYR